MNTFVITYLLLILCISLFPVDMSTGYDWAIIFPMTTQVMDCLKKGGGMSAVEGGMRP